MKAERLEREFADRRLPSRGGLLLLPSPDAIALVRRAADEGVPILGVHGFRVAGHAVDSPPGPRVDYSPRVADGYGCWADAEAFIASQGGDGLAFGLTLGDDPVEAV